MADANTVLAKTTDAHDEASRLAGVPTMAEQLATLQTQNTALLASNASKQQKLDDLATLATARVAADAASVDGAAELAIING